MNLSIIIPARNEEQNLPVLLCSINAQTVKPPEVIVVDDGSTDRTAEVAREFGAAVIASKPLPDGWRGKTWACQQGAQAATGDLLLFLDADTWFAADNSAAESGCSGGSVSRRIFSFAARPALHRSAATTILKYALRNRRARCAR